MGKRKDLSEFDKDQIVMARWLGQSNSKTAALVGCSRSAVVSIYQKCSKEGTAVNRRQGHGRPRFIDARGERRLACVVRSNRQATVAQIAQEVNAGSDRKMSEYTVHHSLMHMGLHSRWPLSTTESSNSGHMSIRTGPQSNGRRWPGLMNHVFFYITRMAGCVCVASLGNTWHQDALWEEGKPAEAVWCFGKCSAGKPWVLPSMWMLIWHVPPT